MDLNELKIELTEYQIKTLKKEAFKRILKCKLGEKAYEYLLNLKETHSKTEHLLNYKLQDYLLSENLSFKQKRLLFSLRTRSIHVKRNYKNKYKFNMLCSLCPDQKVKL